MTAQIAGKVVGITDGDTITVLSDRKQIKVRIAGIDAPEFGQDFGRVAKKYLLDLIFNQTVRLEGSKADRNGRLIAKVLFDGKDVGLVLVQSGYAWHYKEYTADQTEADKAHYAQAETIARERQLNLWKLPNPAPPWEFRSGGRTARQPVSYPPVTSGKIIGNKNSMIYHKPGCSTYNKVAPQNRVYFDSPLEAETAGYRAAKNC
ncbi:MAG: thermonuclease family protein [Pyrinomonadaceae bacterium]